MHVRMTDKERGQYRQFQTFDRVRRDVRDVCNHEQIKCIERNTPEMETLLHSQNLANSN